MVASIPPTIHKDTPSAPPANQPVPLLSAAPAGFHFEPSAGFATVDALSVIRQPE
jgi:hypothetical protein